VKIALNKFVRKFLRRGSGRGGKTKTELVLEVKVSICSQRDARIYNKNTWTPKTRMSTEVHIRGP
jgi:hypothetical protein